MATMSQPKSLRQSRRQAAFSMRSISCPVSPGPRGLLRSCNEQQKNSNRFAIQAQRHAPKDPRRVTHLERFQEKCTRFSARKARQIKKLEHILRLENRRMCSSKCDARTPRMMVTEGRRQLSQVTRPVARSCIAETTFNCPALMRSDMTSLRVWMFCAASLALAMATFWTSS